MIRIDLPRCAFADRVVTVAKSHDTTVIALRLASGIEALRIVMPRLSLLVLSYRGQQVWQAWVDGRPLGMLSMTEEPLAGDTLLESFGAFLFHCGLLGTAAPGPEDDHPLHGELPLAPLDDAWIEIGEESGRTQLRICGTWEFARAVRAHYRLSADQTFDPEAVFLIDFRADENGFAHSVQVHPDGQGDWIAHRPTDCPVGIRWISRTPEQDCIALAEPSTSGLTGFTAERRAGRVPVLDPGATWSTVIRLGRLDPDATRRMMALIDRTAGR